MPVLLAPDQAPTLHELLTQANTVGLDCAIQGDAAAQAACRIQGLGGLLSAGPTEISFLSNPRLQDQLHATQAAAVILTPKAWEAIEPGSTSFIPVVCSQPYVMYALLAQWFDQHRLQRLPTGIHPT